MAGNKKSSGTIFDVACDGPKGCRHGWQATKNPPKRVSSQPSDILSVAIRAWSSSLILSDPSLQGMCLD
jgi:hypothetical protein